MSRTVSIFIIVILVLTGAGLVIWERRDSKALERQSVTSESAYETGATAQTEDTSVATNAADDDQDTKKAPNTQAIVKNTPVVYTSYGHAANNPIKKSQTVSTTCTTDPGAECTVIFTNKDNQTEVIEFEPQTTDAQGVAVWEWAGGIDVTSGTWKVAAKAGTKASNFETIYIK